MPVLIGEYDQFWTPERIGKLVVLRQKGWSASAIGQELGTSRHAVCSKARRLSLAPPPTKASQTPARPKLKPRPPVPAQEPVPEQVIRFLDRRDDQCAAIVDGRGDDNLALCCGKPRLPGGPWCREHFLLYTEPPKERRDGKASYRD